MNRLRVLGLALVAVFAVAASAASASKFRTVGEVYPVKVKAESTSSNNVFKIGSTSVECKTAKFTSGSISAASETIKVHPTYENCKAFGIVSATVTTTGCEYNIHTNEEVNIECEGTKKITIKASTCEVTVGSQTKTKVGNKEIAGPPKEIEIKDNVTSIVYNSNDTGIGCPANGKTGTESEYTGTNIAFGVNPSKEAEKIGIEVK